MERMENFTKPHSFGNYTVLPFWEIGTLEMCMLTFSFMFSLPIHSYVLWHTITGTGSGAASELFSCSLSVCGMFFSVYSLFILMANWFPFKVLIVLTHFLIGMGVTGHPLFQCLMCVERYLAVVHPVTFLKYKPLRYRVICCAAAWIITLASCLYSTIMFISFHTFFYTLSHSTQFLLFFLIQLFCLVAVLRALKQSGPGERKREKEENHMKRRAFHLILVTTFSLVVKYVPFTASGLSTVLFNVNFRIFWSVSYICFVLADLVHPFHYMYRTGKIPCFVLPKLLQL